MQRTTVGQLMINRALPEELRDYNRVLDKQGVKAVLQQVAERYPEKYREVAQALNNVGRTASFTTGGQSFGLKSLRTTMAAQKMRTEMKAKMQRIHGTPGLSDEQRNELVILAATQAKERMMPLLMEEAKSTDNPILRQITSGARGKGGPAYLASLIGADLLYTDHKGRILPMPVTHSYAQGLDPVEYFAGAFGARKGVIDLKLATQDAGTFAKELVRSNHRLMVTADDDDVDYDESTPRGMPVDVADTDNEGSLLAHPVAGYKRNTELTPKILKDIKNRGHDQILVRSPTVGGPRDGGVYARDVGHRERGRVAPIGDWVGIAAAQALAEPVTQAQISSKHTGGVAGAGAAAAISGFKYISQLAEVPKKFPGGAAHAQTDGTVHSIRDAPQGGRYVTVGNEEHYVAGQFELKVKKGDKLEAGDILSEGIPSPAEIVKHKGIGEGRMYFGKVFRQALEDIGQTGHRRNIELLSRGLIDHVRMTDEHDDFLPDQVVPYQTLERGWKPRAGHTMTNPSQSVGRYLERPVLHYTVGTRVTPSMLANLNKFGVKQLATHGEPPPFQPEMVPARFNVQHDPDWMARFLGGYQEKTLLRGVHQGATTDTAGTSYVPALAEGVNFGRAGATQGWKPTAPPSKPSVLDNSPSVSIPDTLP